MLHEDTARDKKNQVVMLFEGMRQGEENMSCSTLLGGTSRGEEDEQVSS